MNLIGNASEGEGLCRTCMKKVNNFVEIFSKKESSLLQMLTTFTHLQLLQGDGLPQKICFECRNKIVSCYNFKMMCENADYTLRDLSNDQQLDNESADGSDISDNSRYKCQQCIDTFCSLEALKQHNAKHVQDKPYHCAEGGCRRSFDSSPALQVHEEVNHAPVDAAYPCRACGRKYRHARSLRQHLITHTEPGRFSCQHCHKAYAFRHHMTAHQKIHTKEKPFLCQQCAASFATKDRLRVHMKRHGDSKEHSCLICNKSFISSYDLKMHVNVHSGERAYMCAECGKQFRNKRSLLRHNARHVDPSINTDTLSKNKDPEYECNICKRNLRTSAALDKHTRTHLSGERSFKCKTCSWMFTRVSHLRVHISRRHSSLAADVTADSVKN